MKTVTEVSRLTGITIRTLHHYDSIGLLPPTKKSPAGYRLYDHKALERLQQILMFREFQIPLKEIKTIICNPLFDTEAVLQSQRLMLMKKKEHLEDLIAHMDDLIGGSSIMNFDVFKQEDIQALYQAQFEHMTDVEKKAIIKEYGSQKAYREHYINQMSQKTAQKNLEKVIEWYGDKDDALSVGIQGIGQEALQSYQTSLDLLIKSLSQLYPMSVDRLEVKQLMGAYDLIVKKMYGLSDPKDMMSETAKLYLDNTQASKAFDQTYGSDMANYFSRAILEFYQG